MLSTRHKKRALISLAAGLVVGSILLIAQQWLGAIIEQELAEELVNSCECEVSFESVNVSILRQTAWVENVTAQISDINKLEVGEVIAFFDLSRIFQKRILITELLFKRAIITHLGASGVLQKIIEGFASESDDSEAESSWKVRLKTLNVRNAEAVHHLERFTFPLSGLSAKLTFDDGDVSIFGTINQVSAVRTETQETLTHQGSFRGQFLVKDSITEIKNAVLRFKKSTFKLSGTLQPDEDRIGPLDYRVSLSDLFLNPVAEGTFEGQSIAYKAKGGLKVKGALASTTPVGIAYLEESIDVIQNLTGQYQIDPDKISISKLHATHGRSEITLIEPITFTDDLVSGAIEVSCNNYSNDAFDIQSLAATLRVSGPIENPIIESEGAVEGLANATIRIPKTNFSVKNQNDQLTLAMRHQGRESGVAELHGQVSFKNRSPALQQASFSLDEFQLGQIFPNAQGTTLDDVKLSGNGALSGKLQGLELDGNMEVQLESQHFRDPLIGEATFEDAEVKAKLYNPSKTIAIDAILNAHPSVKSSLNIVFDEFTPADYDPDFRCARLSLALDYDFFLHAATSGDGQLQLDKLALGCSPYRVANTETKTFPISSGTMKVPVTHFSSSETDFQLSGSVDLSNNFDLKAEGSLYLQSLLPFVPDVDDLKGTMHTTLSLEGPINDPQLVGKANLNDAEFISERLGVDAHNINLNINFSERKIIIDEFTGDVNDGECTVQAQLIPDSPENSEVVLTCINVSLTPFEETFALVDAQLALRSSESGKPEIAGNIFISHGELQKELNVSTLVASIAEYLFEEHSEMLTEKSRMPDINLAVDITASRNLFVLTNLLESELTAEVFVRGNLDRPRVRGKMTVLSGWFGFRDRRFDISSGELRFTPTSAEPKLDIIGERLLYLPTGETVFVVLEASGPISNPTVKLSSDSQLSEQQLLTLLTTSASSPLEGTQTRLRRQEAEWSLLSSQDDNQLVQLLSHLTSIDSIYVEPRLDKRTGLIEPTLVAEKRLLEDLELQGSSFITSTAPSSQLALIYKLSPKLRVIGLIDTDDSQDRTSLEADIAYTFLPYQPLFLDIIVDGNEEFSAQEILDSLRVNSLTRLPVADVERLGSDIVSFYRSRGWFEAQVFVNCHRGTVFCRDLSIRISESDPTYVSSIRYSGNPLPVEINQKDIPTLPSSQVASEKFASDVKWRVLNALRSEGYISARVTTTYEIDPATGQFLLDVNIRTGRAVSFSFAGNKVFDAKDFLRTINLFTRVQPFGSNTINILVQNIERLYRERGYLYASIDYQELVIPESGRTQYLVSIDEDTQIRVKAVRFDIQGPLNEAEFLQNVRELFPHNLELLLRPEFARDEELQFYQSALKSFLVQQGYPATDIVVSINPVGNEDLVEIHYDIDLGEVEDARVVQVKDFPDSVALPAPETKKQSSQQLQTYMRKLHAAMRLAGYRKSDLFLDEEHSNEKIAVVQVNAGPRTVISDIVIEGLNIIDEAAVRSELTFDSGAPWNQVGLNDTRKKLLRMGLFSRVDFLPLDGKLDSPQEKLLIRLVERPLRTLEVGVGANSTLGAHLFGEATDKSLFKDGRSLSLRLDSYYQLETDDITQGIANLRFRVPEVLSSPYTYSNDLRFQKLDLDTFEYDVERVALDTTIYRTFGVSSLSVSHGLKRDDLSNVSPDVVLSDADLGLVFLSIFNLNFSYDKRDNPINPSSGFFVRLDSSVASAAIGSEENFYKLGGKFSALQPLGDSPFSLAFSVQAGGAWTFGSTPEVPITQRFYLGGRTSVRGFRENSLGPRGELGGVIGGDFSLAENFEFRYAIAETFSTHLFFDAGNVFLQDSSVDFDDIRTSAGLGFRYLSPIGPIGFDFGMPLDEKEGEPSFRLHFSVGTSF